MLKILFFILISIGFINCSTQKNLESTSSESVRKIASTEFNLKELETEIKTINDIFPKLGNPRYYVFEEFNLRASKLLELFPDASESEKYLISSLKLAGCYKAMVDAGIYLNFSHLVEKDSPEVLQHLENLEYMMNLLQQDLVKRFGVVPVETKDLYEEKERVALIKYLTGRVSRNSTIFVNKKSEQGIVKGTLGQILAVRNRSISNDLKRVVSNPEYKRTLKLFSNLSLPESGDIDGSADSFDKVMSVQISMEVINFLIEKQLRVSR